MTYSDETLMAYVDDELDPATATAIAEACAHDRALAARVEAQRRLRHAVHAAYAPVLDEPPPDRLLELLQPAPAPKVIELADARASKAPRPARWSWREWGAMAASVVLGILVGALALRPAETPLATADGQLVARGVLAQALTRDLAAEQRDDAPVRIGLSFVAKDGTYCRTFALAQGAPLAGLACRADGEWRVVITAQGGAEAAPASGYRTAGTGLPPAVLRAVDESIAGSALDAEAERRARESGWQR